MTHRLTSNYAKNYCNRTLIVKVIVENVVTCFLGTRCIMILVDSTDMLRGHLDFEHLYVVLLPRPTTAAQVFQGH